MSVLFRIVVPIPDRKEGKRRGVFKIESQFGMFVRSHTWKSGLGYPLGSVPPPTGSAPKRAHISLFNAYLTTVIY